LTEGGSSNSSKSRAFFRAAQLASLGLEMGVSVAIGLGIGYLLDRWLGTKPWLMLVFILLGVAAGFRSMFEAARRATASKEREDDGSQTTRPD
jgi:ATP synthase protein I